VCVLCSISHCFCIDSVRIECTLFIQFLARFCVFVFDISIFVACLFKIWPVGQLVLLGAASVVLCLILFVIIVCFYDENRYILCICFHFYDLFFILSEYFYVIKSCILSNSLIICIPVTYPYYLLHRCLALLILTHTLWPMNVRNMWCVHYLGSPFVEFKVVKVV
jgi:hypothetical protein